MGDVILFPTKSHLDTHGAALMSELAGPAVTKADERPSEARRNAELREITNAVQRVRTFKERDDAQKAASNLTQMLREAREEKGVTSAEIASKVWPDDEKPSKRFYKLTIPSKGDLDEGRIRCLQTRTSHYRKVAAALGELVPGWSPEAALVRVFRNTSVDLELGAIIEGREARAADPDFCWRNLADMLDSLAQSVSGKSDLRAHLQRIAVTGGRYDLAKNEIVPAHFDLVSGGDRLLHYGPLADDFALWDHFPPIPSVPIFDELLVPPFRHALTITATESGDVTTIEVQVRVWRQIRFAVGPVDTIERAGSLFEVRTWVELADEGKQIELPMPWITLEFDDEVEIRIDDREFRGTIDFSSHDLGGKSWKDMLMWKNMNGRSKFTGEWRRSDLQPQHNWAAWRRVTPELCAELLNRPKLNDITPDFRVYFPNPAEEPTATPEGTLGAALEKALRAKDEPCLASMLLVDARRLVTLVGDELKRRQAEAITLNESAMAAWSGK